MVFLLPDKVLPILKKFYPTVKFSKSKKTIIFYTLHKNYTNIIKLLNLLDSKTKSI